MLHRRLPHRRNPWSMLCRPGSEPTQRPPDSRSAQSDIALAITNAMVDSKSTGAAFGSTLATLHWHGLMQPRPALKTKIVIVSKFNLNQDFSPTEPVLSALDETSQASFGGDLRALFDHPPLVNKLDHSHNPNGPLRGIEPELKQQIDIFLDALGQFLDLLLSIRNLPPGNRFIPYLLLSGTPHSS
ncbi:hypothetical protein PCANC_10981 [Puccinia coronata f. sp. avenae]|uniref:Uncharacterized protein n=1 Tax=Puccinia coronata f. sp. avenae TaxID=200324 RepID=A0A2N5UWS3_9BASI|nr:hypothetical protein PCANC_10981 [Puccinia coronata f. sp. avenae]